MQKRYASIKNITLCLRVGLAFKIYPCMNLQEIVATSLPLEWICKGFVRVFRNLWVTDQNYQSSWRRGERTNQLSLRVCKRVERVHEKSLGEPYRWRINTNEKTKVVASVWVGGGVDVFNSLPLSVLPRTIMKNRMNFSFFQIILVQFILLFKIVLG